MYTEAKVSDILKRTIEASESNCSTFKEHEVSPLIKSDQMFNLTPDVLCSLLCLPAVYQSSILVVSRIEE